jgi:hypothetical protein
MDDLTWVPTSCTLPTVEQPFRVAEFDDLLATAVRAAQRLAPTTLRLTLDATAEGQAKDLARRESSCCSFFDFEFTPPNADTLTLDITVPAAYAEVLDAFASRVTSTAIRC